MSIVNSPKPEYAVDGNPREQMPRRRKLVRSLTIVMVVVAIVLGIYLTLVNNTVNQALGRTGTVQGIVLDERGQPLVGAGIFLAQLPDLKTTTDGAGHFVLSNVPDGQQSIVVTQGQWGQEYPLVVFHKDATDAGTLTYLTPPESD